MTGLIWVGLLVWAVSVQAQARPTITITTPTTASTYATSTPSLLLGGTTRTQGNRQVTQVTWANDRGGRGLAQGTTTWQATIGLQEGVNRLTVTATDSRGQTHQDSLTATLLLAPPPGPITVEWSYGGSAGDHFVMERCTVPCGAMAPVAAVALVDRQWTDTAVAPDRDYCYRMAVSDGGFIGAYSNTMCSP